MFKCINLFIFGFLFGLQIQAQKDHKPVPVIFDSDMGFDYDDAGALAVLHALADRGEARILATIASTKYEGVASVFDVLNTYYRRPYLPIGVPKGEALSLRDTQKWSDSLMANYPHRIKKNAEVAGAVDLYRKLLSEQPDNSVTLLTVGFFTNIAALMQSGPDVYSELTGKELVARKVGKMVSMAGEFPSGLEFNIEEDAAAAAYVFEHWEKPVIFCGFEVGNKILTGLPLVQDDSIRDNPVKDVYRISIPQAASDKNGRMSWDQVAVLVAVRGHEPYFSLKEGGIVLEENGFNRWDDTKKGQYYLLQEGPVHEVQEILETLMAHEPSDDRKPLVVFVVGDHEYSSELTMPLIAGELQKNYGMKVKVLTAYPDHNSEENIPGLEALEEADLAVFFLRWRRLPEDQLNYIENYIKSGLPVVGLRTTTHAFKYPEGHDLERWNAFGEFTFNSPPGWEKAGHTHYGHESTTVVSVIDSMATHPILEGVEKVFPAKSWLYTLLPDYPLKGSTALLMGSAVNPDDPEAIDHPVAWTGTNSFGGTFFMTTLGHPEDFQEVSMKRLILNAIHWTLGLQVPQDLRGELEINVPYNTH